MRWPLNVFFQGTCASISSHRILPLPFHLTRRAFSRQVPRSHMQKHSGATLKDHHYGTHCFGDTSALGCRPGTGAGGMPKPVEGWRGLAAALQPHFVKKAKYKSKYKHPTDLYTDLRHQENFISWPWQVHCACIMLAFFFAEMHLQRDANWDDDLNTKVLFLCVVLSYVAVLYLFGACMS